MIHFDEMEYMLAAWYVGGPGCKEDWFGVVYRSKAQPDRWQITYRFRYYVDGSEPFDGKDRKSWYAGSADGARPEAELIAAVDTVTADVAARLGFPVQRIDVRGPPEIFMAQASNLPWIHLQYDVESS